ncbi:uncharacterized protein PHACADRAFT_258945 [Phanerochaete carnosa HHB-10118-sp]|uniref:F-box domain-containing protein n=1 Tax=Phanerochaete carnosa (strain HHB-10118-sp) TaxID=650164 RepID=K5WWK9_PHACS|nr:uncharacterized protein PHACADRAFT_258945 [Phanerochaete carnosa HHB-10118-sp]EKM54822.1 hypothetical protein PHACADRAFT_258945 [Phanerochaete carnosa HHB-10118-sp]
MIQLLPELLDTVFARLNVNSSSKQNLTSCSLVWNVWNVIARPHLFRQVTYTLTDNNKDREAECNLRVAFRGIYAFLEEHPELAVCTKELSLKTVPAVSRLTGHSTRRRAITTRRLSSACSAFSLD